LLGHRSCFWFGQALESVDVSAPRVKGLWEPIPRWDWGFAGWDHVLGRLSIKKLELSFAMNPIRCDSLLSIASKKTWELYKPMDHKFLAFKAYGDQLEFKFRLAFDLV
jgi:hypothetical protein